VATVLVRVVGPAVAHAVALGERPVEQYVLRFALAQDLEQAGRPGGQEVDYRRGVGVCGADRDVEAGGELGHGVVLTEVHQSDERALLRWELAAAVTLSGDDEHGDPLDQRMGQVECGRIRNQRGTWLMS
jgi:hypothetical protein